MYTNNFLFLSYGGFWLQSTIPGWVGSGWSVGSVFIEINTNSAQLELVLWLSLAITKLINQ